MEKLNPITVYQNLTQNDRLPLTKVRIEQLLLNLYDEDGNLWVESYYVNNEKRGLVQRYHKNGQLYEKFTIGNSKIEKIYEDYTVENNTLEGLYEAWYENGVKSYETTYMNGKVERKFQMWYENGQTRIIGYFYNLRNEIINLYYNKDGSFIELKFYKNNRLVDLKKHVKRRTKKYKEELIAKVYYPDRLERIAKLYSMDVMDYMDCID